MADETGSLKRRDFLRLGAISTGLAVSGGSILEGAEEPKTTGGMKYRMLGDTGLKVSEISFGTYGLDNPALLEAAFDAGINMICTCADYQGGQAEETVGKALANSGKSRDDLIIFTGTTARPGATKERILETIDTSLKRLRTDHIEIWRAHNVADPADLKVDGFLEAFEAARKAGKVSHLGLSGHKGGLQDCLNTAVLDGRYKVFLCKYDFASYQEQEQIVANAAKKGIGTIAFKTNAGARQKEIKDLEAGGLSFEQATIKWALSNQGIASVAAGITNFDQIKEYCGAVGKKVSRAETDMLNRYASIMHDRYCRFCATCEPTCPGNVAVADVMRYAMYFKYYGREKDSMQLYAALPREKTAAACEGCEGHCRRDCPFDRHVREELVEAHRLLSFA